MPEIFKINDAYFFDSAGNRVEFGNRHIIYPRESAEPDFKLDLRPFSFTTTFEFPIPDEMFKLIDRILHRQLLKRYILSPTYVLVIKRKGEPRRVITKIAGRPLNHGTH